jgi:hypothetical protein
MARKIHVYGMKGSEGFENADDLREYIENGIVRRKYLFDYTQNKKTNVIVLSFDGVAHGHFDIKGAPTPSRKERGHYIYDVAHRKLYKEPVKLSLRYRKQIQFGKLLSEKEFLRIQKAQAGSKSERHRKTIAATKKRRGANAPAVRRFRYWVEGNRSVEPLHNRLQERFVKYLLAQDIHPKQNVDFIDVQYTASQRRMYFEIKPTENVATRYAIRAAIGQLLEHRYKNNAPTAALEIVIGSKPRPAEIDFVKSIGLRLTYYDEKSKTFVSV